MATLDDKITDEKLEQLISQLRRLHDKKVLRNRDWVAMYDLMLEACQRDEAEILEQYLAESIAPDTESEGE